MTALATPEVILAADVGAGGIGFLVVLALAVATVLLIRSMATRLGNVKRNAASWPDAEAAKDDDKPTTP